MTRFDNLLALDTATRKLHLALTYGDDRLVKSSITVAKSHGQVLLKKIAELFDSAGLARGSLEAVIVSVGPGSFTGLRIGLAAAKGLAVACGVPILGVGLFELAAWKMKQGGGSGVVIVPSRKGEYYVAEVESGRLDPANVVVMAERELPPKAAERPVYSLGFDPAGVLTDPHTLNLQGQLSYDAADLIYFGRERLAAGERSDLATLEPAYLQKAIAEVRFDERHGTGQD